MDQGERLDYLLRYLLAERASAERALADDASVDGELVGGAFADGGAFTGGVSEVGGIPGDFGQRKLLLRSLMNVRGPLEVDPEFLVVQDEYLREEIALRGVVLGESVCGDSSLGLWKGDITRLKVDAIVNAANSSLLGCFIPHHSCIDNAIHSYAGVQLRGACDELMRRQRHPEPTGRARVTDAYNLPCKKIIHTVGPIVSRDLTDLHCEQLAASYRSCLAAALECGLESVALCCISTGEYGFPQEKAAEIALRTVRGFFDEQGLGDPVCSGLGETSSGSSRLKVIFNVFKESDYVIYERLLGEGA